MPQDYKKQQLIFGSGGGFAGTENIYFLQENGNLFYQQGMKGKVNKIATFSKKDVSSLFSEAAQLNISEVSFRVPGNLYFFITQGNQADKNRIVWGGQKSPPSGFKELYAGLNELVKQANTKNE